MFMQLKEKQLNREKEIAFLGQAFMLFFSGSLPEEKILENGV